jgi:hypothetical protein
MFAASAHHAPRPVGVRLRAGRPRKAALGPRGLLASLAVLGSLTAAAADRVPPFPRESLRPGRIPAAPGPARSSALVLVLFDSLPTPVVPFPILAREVEAIFREIGVEVTWRQGGPGKGCEDGPVPELPVIVLPADPRPGREGEHAMGLVIRDQQPRHAIWVFLSGVRWALGQPSLPGFADARRLQEIGLAVARVVAHEVVHAIAPEQPHTRGGLMNPALNRAFLLGPRTRLEGPLVRAFLNQLWASSKPGGPDRGIAALTPEEGSP